MICFASHPRTETSRRPLRAAACALVLMAAVAPSLGQSGGDTPTSLPVQARGLDVEEHVGQQLPLELTFINSEGKRVVLGDYFKGAAAGSKPAIMALVYYKCPVACQVVMQRMAQTMNDLDLAPGKDYNALLFSFDPTEDTHLAHSTKIGFISAYNKEVTPEVDAGWEFHTSDEYSSRALSEALGFKIREIDKGVYSHPIALFIITPEGKISRYLYGFDYPARDVKLALLEASQGKLVKTVGDRILSFCYLYDDKAGRYTVAVFRIMQLAGLATALALGTLVGGLIISDRIKRKRNTGGQAASGAETSHDTPQTGGLAT